MMTKEYALERLRKIAEKGSGSTHGFNHIPCASSYEQRNNAGEKTVARTYLKVTETRDDSLIHNVDYLFGHIDDATSEYFAGDNDLTKISVITEAKADEWTAKREKTPEEQRRDYEHAICDKVVREMLGRYADKIAAEMGYDFKVRDSLEFMLFHDIHKEVFDDKIIKDRVAEIIKKDILDFVDKWVRKPGAGND